MKIDSDTFVCMICLAAFIGYTLGLRNMVKNTCKTQQCHKVTQTNLSELAEILTSNHLMVDNSQIKMTMPVITTANITQTQTQTPTQIQLSTPINDNNVYDSFMLTTTNVQNVQEDDFKVAAENEKESSASLPLTVTNDKMTTQNNSNTTTPTSNNSEEEYEVILENGKKNYTTNLNKPQYYFGWFDSIF
jgi:N-acetylmuramoyl-L-alanine amidase CwlA